MNSGDYVSYDVGVDFQMPLYRRKERAGIAASQYGYQQAQIELDRTRQQVIYQHRKAVREIENMRLQVEASHSRVRAERDRLEKQRIGHEQGVTTSHDLLNVLEKYASAQVIEIRSIVDYYLALIALENVRGTLLDTLGFSFVPMEKDPVVAR
jgi:outer membrane protein TolC